VSDTRIEFVMECLKDINRQYIIKGSRISLLYGDPIEELENLKQKGYDIYFNKDANHFRQEMEQQAREKFQGFSGDGVVRNKEGTRKKWRNSARKYFQSKPPKIPESFEDNPIKTRLRLTKLEKNTIFLRKKKSLEKEVVKRLENDFKVFR